MLVKQEQNKTLGIDLTLCVAEECLKDRTRDYETMSILKEEPIAWSTALCKNDRVFLTTACLLLKLNLYSVIHFDAP